MSAVILAVGLVVVLFIGIELFRWAHRPEARRLRVIRKIGNRRWQPRASADKKWIVIGTSGSHDYLRDATGSKRYWPVQVPGPTPARARDDQETE